MILFRRHDRYILKAFWASFGAVLLFFTAIVIVIYLADRSARMLRNFPQIRERGYEPMMVMLGYFASLIPFIWLQLFPLASVLAATFTLSRLTRHNEIAPLVTAGVSTRRITLPIVLSGVFLAGFLFVFQERVVPPLSRTHMKLSRLLNKSEPDRVTPVPHFDDPGGARLSVAAYQPMARALEGALLTFRDEDGTATELRFYPLLKWNLESRQWLAVEGGTVFPLGEDRTGTVRKRLPEGEPAPLDADVQLLEVSVLKDLSMGLSSRETAALVRADPDNPRLIHMHHDQLTRCLHPLLLLLLGLPFCFSIQRRSAIPGTVAVLGATATLYAFSFLSASLARSGELNPVVLAWMPTVQLGSAGLALWLTMRS